MRIYEAKSRIAEYGREAEADELVMELAKLNYNLVQLQYQQELKIITRSSYLLPPLEIIGRLAMFLAKLSQIAIIFERATPIDSSSPGPRQFMHAQFIYFRIERSTI